MFAALAGASRDVRKVRHDFSPCRTLLFVGAVALFFVTGCRSDRPPEHLLDGSKALPPPVELEGVEQSAVLTRVRVLSAEDAEAGSPARTCFRTRGNVRPITPVVERVGVLAKTLTFRDNSRRWLQACDDSPGRTDVNRTWCGGAAGRLYGGHLRDPRLNMAACSTVDGDPMGFAWVELDPKSKYLVVEQARYAEVYETAGDLPVRIATVSGVSIEGSRATFELSEHDGTGRVLRTYRLEARVAG